MADPVTNRPTEKTVPPATRLTVLRALVSLASTEVAAQLDAFVTRLAEALSKLSAQGVRSEDTEAGASALQHLKRNQLTFHRLVSSCLTELLLQEIDSAHQQGQEQSKLARGAMDLSLVTFEAMEQKVLIDNLSQALLAANSDTFNPLNLRIAHLMQREEISLAENPFRPEVFLKAVSDAWTKFDLNSASHLVILRQMRPEIFLQLEPVLQALNAELVRHGILPNLTDAYRLKKAESNPNKPPAAVERRNLPLYSRLQRWLSPTFSTEGGGGGTGRSGGGGGGAVHPGLISYLTGLQKQPQPASPPAPVNASVLRQIRAQAPAGTLTQADSHAIELLARTLEHVFEEPCIPPGVKQLLSQLQVPLLKAALSDRDFFFREDHPARRFLDTVARTSVACDQEKGADDPLFKMIEKIVDRVQQEYEQQIELFDDVLKDLESFVAQQTQVSGDAYSQAVAEAARQEKINRAKELAENDVAMRIESGEAAGFVETFLETQWTRVLGLAHSVQDSKPEALKNALKTMDDLIWSVKPKTTAEERKDLLTQLPSMLSTLNAWLNVVNWDGPDRVKFFSTLAERHAAIVRTAGDLSPRQQLEITLNVAQKASERRLNKRAREQVGPIADEFMHLVDGLEPDTWIEFARNGGTRQKTRLAWISARRTRFVFANRQGQEPFILTFDELAQAFRDERAAVVAADSVVDRALAAAL
ncbi:MAG: hypothetical protein V7642_4733, partial [Burkholderiales bacterium]